jgi:hypothetical protein
VAIDPEYFQVAQDGQKQWCNEDPDYPETAPPARFCPLQSVRCLAEAIMTIVFSLGTGCDRESLQLSENKSTFGLDLGRIREENSSSHFFTAPGRQGPRPE